jgi:hypothetical protein
MSPVIYLFPSELSEFRTLCCNNQKIDAIKLLRNSHASRIKGSTVPVISLREAKETTEYYMDHVFKGEIKKLPDKVPAPQGPFVIYLIKQFSPIKHIVVDMGEGEIQVSLSELSLKFIGGLTDGSVSMDNISKLIDLYNRIKAWEDSL